MRRSFRSFAFVGVACGSLAFGVTLVTAHGGDPQQIHACVDNATGNVVITADPTPYGDPRRQCGRPSEQHALDWSISGVQGPAGPPGPAGAPGSTASVTALEYERGLTLIGPEKEKAVVAIAVASGARYMVTAKAVVEHRRLLSAECSLSVLGASNVDDVARASAAHESSDATQTLYLQELYRVPPRTGLTIFRVRCRNQVRSGVVPNAQLAVTDASIHALRLSTDTN